MATLEKICFRKIPGILTEGRLESGKSLVHDGLGFTNRSDLQKLDFRRTPDLLPGHHFAGHPETPDASSEISQRQNDLEPERSELLREF